MLKKVRKRLRLQKAAALLHPEIDIFTNETTTTIAASFFWDMLSTTTTINCRNEGFELK